VNTRTIIYLLAGSLIITVILYFYFFVGQNTSASYLFSSLDIMLWAWLGFALTGYALVLISTHLTKIFSWRTSLGRRFLAGFLTNLGITFLITFIFIYLYSLFPNEGRQLSFLEFIGSDFNYKLMVLLAFLVFVFTLTDLSLFSYYQFAVDQIRTLQNKRHLLDLRFDALKKQLSPHFLFNSLNTVSGMLYRDTVETEKYVRALVSSYRQIFELADYNLIFLKEELEILQTYKYLLEIRYQDAVHLDVNIPENTFQLKVPPLSLQLLVENAIKHNLVSDKNPLSIEVYIEEGEFVVVKNNLKVKPYLINVENKIIQNPTALSTHTGLNNLKSRYDCYTDKNITIEKNTHFIVKLPLLSNHDEEKFSA